MHKKIDNAFLQLLIVYLALLRSNYQKSNEQESQDEFYTHNSCELCLKKCSKSNEILNSRLEST